MYIGFFVHIVKARGRDTTQNGSGCNITKRRAEGERENNKVKQQGATTGFQYWNLPRWSWVDGAITSLSLTGRWSLCLLLPPFWSCTLYHLRALFPPPQVSAGCTRSNRNMAVWNPKSRTAYLHSFLYPPYIYRGVLCDTGRPSVHPFLSAL